MELSLSMWIFCSLSLYAVQMKSFPPPTHTLTQSPSPTLHLHSQTWEEHGGRIRTPSPELTIPPPHPRPHPPPPTLVPPSPALHPQVHSQRERSIGHVTITPLSQHYCVITNDKIPYCNRISQHSGVTTSMTVVVITSLRD